MAKLQYFLIFIAISAIIVSGCSKGNITGYSIVKTKDINTGNSVQQAENTEVQPPAQEVQQAPVPKEPVKDNSKLTEKDLLAENIESQGPLGLKNNAPSILITEPDQGDLATKSPYTIWWKAEDPDKDKVLIKLEYLASEDWILLSENEPNDRSYDWDLGTLPNGNYQIRATISDGRASSSDSKGFEIRR